MHDEGDELFDEDFERERLAADLAKAGPIDNDQMHRDAAAEDQTWRAAALSLDEQLGYMNAQISKPKVARALRDRGLSPDDAATDIGGGQTIGWAVSSGRLTIAEALGRLGRSG